MDYSNISYVLASVLFILGIKKLSHPKTARKGNSLAALGMLVAIVSTLIAYEMIDYQMISIGMIIGAIIGALFAQKVEMNGTDFLYIFHWVRGIKHEDSAIIC